MVEIGIKAKRVQMGVRGAKIGGIEAKHRSGHNGRFGFAKKQILTPKFDLLIFAEIFS